MMNKAKTFNLGVVSSTHSLRSKPRPFLGGCSTRQRQRKYHQYPHDTVRIWGIEREAGQVEEDTISPSKKLGFGFICE